MNENFQVLVSVTPVRSLSRPPAEDETSRATAVLLIEPGTHARQVLAAALQGEGYEVREAVDARGAAALLASQTADLVLVNLDLPDLDGVELTRWLRMLPGNAKLPIIGYSGYVAELEQARQASVGFTGLLLKPFLPSHLLRTLAFYLKSKAMVRERPVEKKARRRSRKTSGQGRRILVVEDNDQQRQSLRYYLERLGIEVETACDGDEALELAHAYPPDAILSDVLLPGRDGFELCLAMRRDPRLAQVPIVLSPLGHFEEVDRCLARDLGASDFVPRSLDSPAEAIAALLDTLDADHPRPVYHPRVEVLPVRVA